MICTFGIWNVKEGREDDFERRWQQGVNGAALDYPEVTFRLLRDRTSPRSCSRTAEGWRTVEQVEAMRETPDYQDFVAGLWRLLDSGETSTFELVAEVS